MSYPVFPEVGTGATPLSDRAVLTHYEGAGYEDPSIVDVFESGWEDARPIRSEGRYVPILVHAIMPWADFEIVSGFLAARRMQAEKFTYNHPILGPKLVRYANHGLTWKHPVIGDSIDRTLVEFDLEFREQYG